ncbi:hypothetical protein MRB53_003742 [Persea americana]|uniref:Uncharacterized protein n=1 Tax=Persea americana TaxID=3435 RepID=A0ACC2MYC4_PERAE|nr:hypothetical protein MRB53_003742 [Persea americana]
MAKGEEMEKKAEKKINGWGLFGSKYEDAADLYDKATNFYKLAKSWDKAGAVYIKLANCHLKLESKHEAASAYVDASKCLQKDLCSRKLVRNMNLRRTSSRPWIIMNVLPISSKVRRLQLPQTNARRRSSVKSTFGIIRTDTNDSSGISALPFFWSRSYLSKVAALGVNKVSVVASLTLLLFISSSLAIMGKLQVQTLKFVVICASLIAMPNVVVVVIALANLSNRVTVTFAVAIK